MQIAESTIRSALGSRVKSVVEELGENRDGEPVVRLKVVLVDGVSIAPYEFLELSEKLRQNVFVESGLGFPVISYTTKREDVDGSPKGVVAAE